MLELFSPAPRIEKRGKGEGEEGNDPLLFLVTLHNYVLSHTCAILKLATVKLLRTYKIKPLWRVTAIHPIYEYLMHLKLTLN